MNSSELKTPLGVTYGYSCFLLGAVTQSNVGLVVILFIGSNRNQY